jgi:hypothetical protein
VSDFVSDLCASGHRSNATPQSHIKPKSQINFSKFLSLNALGQGVGIESATSFCIIIPPQPGNGINTNYIAETEREAVSGCTSQVIFKMQSWYL